MHRLFTSQTAAADSAVLTLPTVYSKSATVQIEGGIAGGDAVACQVSLDNSTFYPVEGFDVGDITAAAELTSITADGIYRFDVTGAKYVKLVKTGTNGAIDAYLTIDVG